MKADQDDDVENANHGKDPRKPDDGKLKMNSTIIMLREGQNP